MKQYKKISRVLLALLIAIVGYTSSAHRKQDEKEGDYILKETGAKSV
jgi:hypothetical protein